MAVAEYEPLYTVREVAKILKINMGSVYTEMNEGRLPYILLGSKKVRGTDLERYINSYPTEEVNEKNQAGKKDKKSEKISTIPDIRNGSKNNEIPLQT